MEYIKRLFVKALVMLKTINRNEMICVFKYDYTKKTRLYKTRTKAITIFSSRCSLHDINKIHDSQKKSMESFLC